MFLYFKVINYTCRTIRGGRIIGWCTTVQGITSQFYFQHWWDGYVTLCSHRKSSTNYHMVPDCYIVYIDMDIMYVCDVR